jgi:uncharacterized membrane protein YbhN (UPF0104 family)
MRGAQSIPLESIASNASGPVRSPWRLLLKVGGSAALLTILLYESEPARLWAEFRGASWRWLAAALAIYLLMIVVSAWRWHVLLEPQGIAVGLRALVRSYLVATFFNNFLPSNIGGDVIRIKDTVTAAGSRTLAATIVLLDRGIGLLGLLVVGALGETLVGRAARGSLPVGPAILWSLALAGLGGLAALVVAPTLVSRLLHPLRAIHHDWVDERLNRLVAMFARFRARPGSIVLCLGGAIAVQAILVGFYAAVAASLRIPVPAAHLAVLVPLSFIVQMLPISMNGLGVREATFAAYFRLLGLPIESALALSLLGSATILVFSLSGAAAYAASR